MSTIGLSREDIARVAAEDIPDGSCVNLGIGLPTLIADHVPAGRELLFHSEQGLLGLGPRAVPGEEDWDVINAGKQPVTLLPGASVFSHSDSFLMVRGGHVDIACLGAFQVAANGDLANWSTGSSDQVPAIGGAMDLAAGVAEAWVLMEHCQKDGRPRILQECSYPLTAARCVNRIYTNCAVIHVTPAGLVVTRLAADVTFSQLQTMTGATLSLSPDCTPYAPQLDGSAAAQQRRSASAARVCLEVDRLSDLQPHVGKLLGSSDWLLIEQQRIDDFARVSGDRFWIHVDTQRARRELPQGRTIAHGMLTYSLLIHLAHDIFHARSITNGLNYGANKLRFTAPVHCGARIRLHRSLARFEPVDGGARLTFEDRVEIEGESRPALIAENISVLYEAAP